MAISVNRYVNFELSPFSIDKSYHITLTKEVYDCVVNTNPAWGEKKFSYEYLLIRLFGLMPSDFFHYIQSEYGARLIHKKNEWWVLFDFPNAVDAKKFADECNRRFDLCVKEGYFNEEE